MTKPSSPLPPSSQLFVALQALVNQGSYGVVTGLADEHGLRRDQVYALREHARTALEEAFADRGDGVDRVVLPVTATDIERTVVALRVITPASIRDIEAMLPIIYGQHWSFGKVWSVLNRAEKAAGDLLRQTDLSAIDCVALDEIFSQGRPVFAGIDLDSQYLVQLEVHDSRSGKDWADALGTLRDEQGLCPSHVVKDAGRGLGAGVTQCWPEAQAVDDLFHVVRELGKVSWRLEQRAYAAIAKEEEVRLEHQKVMWFCHLRRERAASTARLRAAKARADVPIRRYDEFEKLRQQALEVLQLCDRGSGRLRTLEEVRVALERIAAGMKTLGGKRTWKVGTYLHNRAAGLACYLDRLRENLAEVTARVGGLEVQEAAVRAYQANLDAQRGGPAWDRRARTEELRASVRELLEVTVEPARLCEVVETVFPILDRRHRASSAIENLNSVLRPYLVVQKHAEQGFLDLFRFYWNHRTRRWGRGKGTSPHEELTGVPTEDWLSLLGYPPSEALARAA